MAVNSLLPASASTSKAIGRAAATILTNEGVPLGPNGSLKRPSVADEVANRLLEDINAGTYPPGGRLPTEPDLARGLGVGRTSVREALAKLRMLGIVEVRRGLGSFVSENAASDPRLDFIQWTAAHAYEIVDIFEVRISLETTGASLAATRATEQDIKSLVDRAEDHANAAEGGSLSDLVRTDQAFHEALLNCSKNEALVRVYNVIVPELVPYRTRSLALENAPTRSVADHLAIVEAVRCHQPAQAHTAALKHLSTLYEEIIQARDKAAMADLNHLQLDRR